MWNSNTPVRQDSEGRYCLNDLHRISGGAEKHLPGHFFSNKGTQELVEEIEKCYRNSDSTPVSSNFSGADRGTYVCKQLVYAYAMWISAKFHLQVINVFDQYVTNPDYGQAPVIKAPPDGGVLSVGP